jgi:hypothetical protein
MSEKIIHVYVGIQYKGIPLEFTENEFDKIVLENDAKDFWPTIIRKTIDHLQGYLDKNEIPPSISGLNGCGEFLKKVDVFFSKPKQEIVE